MTHRVRDAALVVLAAVLTVVFVRLGFWQLSRLGDRRAYNARVEARLRQPAVPPGAIPRDSAAAHFRCVAVRGRYDYARQMVLTSRTRNGAPGVELLTPVRLAGTDTALLVDRGWVYSPDGVRADLARWREADSVAGTGYVVPFGSGRGSRVGQPTLAGHPAALRWVDRSAVAVRVPYPVYPFTVVLDGDTAARPPVPPRVPPPAPDEGPHRSYAVQWFAFAVITVAGTALFLMHARRERGAADPLRGV